MLYTGMNTLQFRTMLQILKRVCPFATAQNGLDASRAGDCYICQKPLLAWMQSVSMAKLRQINQNAKLRITISWRPCISTNCSRHLSMQQSLRGTCRRMSLGRTVIHPAEASSDTDDPSRFAHVPCIGLCNFLGFFCSLSRMTQPCYGRVILLGRTSRKIMLTWRMCGLRLTWVSKLAIHTAMRMAHIFVSVDAGLNNLHLLIILPYIKALQAISPMKILAW